MKENVKGMLLKRACRFLGLNLVKHEGSWSKIYDDKGREYKRFSSKRFSSRSSYGNLGVSSVEDFLETEFFEHYRFSLSDPVSDRLQIVENPFYGMSREQLAIELDLLGAGKSRDDSSLIGEELQMMKERKLKLRAMDCRSLDNGESGFMNEESKTEYILVKQWMRGKDYMLFIPFKDLTFHVFVKDENKAVIDGIRHGEYVYYVVVDPSTYEEHEISSFNARFPDELKMKLEVYELVY